MHKIYYTLEDFQFRKKDDDSEHTEIMNSLENFKNDNEKCDENGKKHKNNSNKNNSDKNNDDKNNDDKNNSDKNNSDDKNNGDENNSDDKNNNDDKKTYCDNEDSALGTICIKKSEEMKMEVAMSGNFESQEEAKILKNRMKAFKLKETLSKFNYHDIKYAKSYVNECIRRLYREWPALFGEDPVRIFVHVDLDAFYASCESLSNEEYRYRPMAVGSKKMLCTANYPARKFGVRAGMPGYHAVKLCPELVIVKPDMKKYEHFSRIVMNILRDHDKDTEIGSIDEASIWFDEVKFFSALNNFHFFIEKYFQCNFSHITIFGKYQKFLNNKKFQTNLDNQKIDFNYEGVSFLISLIRKRIEIETGLTVSAGISVCRGLAKMACSVNKPNGQFVLKDKFGDFLDNKPLDKIVGIGKYTKEVLEKSLNLKTIGDLRNNRHLLFLMFKNKTFNYLFRLSFGLKACESSFIRKPTSGIGCGISFEPSSDLKHLTEIVWRLSGTIFDKMKENDIFGFVYTLKIRFESFKSISRRLKTKNILTSKEKIFDLFMVILKEEIFRATCKIRSLGLRISAIVPFKETNLLRSYLKCKKKEKFSCKVCENVFLDSKNYLLHRYKCEKQLKERNRGLFRYLNSDYKK
ncbi:DNA polymerase kappa [Dictyocoela muelleri]|nr:DNA polymerase kappa [Dictyocoela muelleri]